MLILLTNDDGIDSPGLRTLAREMRRVGEVVVVAPSTQRSGISSSLTLYRPLLARKREEGYSVEGTPADCVKLAVRELLPRPPDLVVSGINLGLNTGTNILYSGTVAGAFEGAHLGIPSFAVSLEVSPHPDWSIPARYARTLVRRMADGVGAVYNINVPARRIRGVRVTVQESEPYRDRFDRRVDPRGRTYYWLCGTPEQKYRANGKADPPTDAWAVAKGFVSVTPLHRDMTHHRWVEKVRARLGT